MTHSNKERPSFFDRYGDWIALAMWLLLALFPILAIPIVLMMIGFMIYIWVKL
ncbi:hypothetical protein [Ferrimonas sp. SCSIO 43195]|uniref:hypothetical protein n=1 Tax=Ferrimonas sp. SCSIO 43195 TaxID=2822844 RepID=UPI002074F8B5|nr:hypothetical protein [Ferrimonas sp. SCSIO 43195]USD38687.1 hypothetical protein J8Z22_06180 [Ferrimonas sp. SCSIO 43195]